MQAQEDKKGDGQNINMPASSQNRVYNLFGHAIAGNDKNKHQNQQNPLGISVYFYDQSPKIYHNNK